MLPSVAVIVVTYNSERDIEECLKHLAEIEYPLDRLTVYLHDNASTDRTPAILKALADRLPCKVDVVLSSENTGFTGANNAAFEKARVAGCEYVLLLNPDAFIEPSSLNRLVEAMVRNPQWALAQPLLVLAQQPDTLNTSGNRLHLLGFGLVVDYGKPRSDVEQAGTCSIDFPSGAACLIRVAALHADEELFDRRYFAYHEDCELSWRLRLRGWKSVMEPTAVVAHRYTFTKGPRKFYLLERNRWLAMLSHYRLGTLLALLPLLMLAGLMVWGHAVLNRWFQLKLGLCFDLWKQGGFRGEYRRRSLANRRVKDREMLREMTLSLDFPDGTPWSVRWILNPVCQVYGAIVRWVVWW